MYIICSNNLKSGEVLSRGKQYSRRDQASNNLLHEVQTYLLNFRYIENHKIVESIDNITISPDIVWYIVRSSEKEHEIHLYKVVTKKIDGWLSSSETTVAEKQMIFSVVDIPDKKEIQTVEKKEPEEPVPSNNMRALMSNVKVSNDLFDAIKRRREFLETRNEFLNTFVEEK